MDMAKKDVRRVFYCERPDRLQAKGIGLESFLKAERAA